MVKNLYEMGDEGGPAGNRVLFHFTVPDLVVLRYLSKML